MTLLDLAGALEPMPTTWTEGWSPSLRARTLGAAAVIIAYLAGVALALRAARRHGPAAAPDSSAPAAPPSTKSQRELSSKIWYAIALCLAFLAVSRLFDLENLATSIARFAVVHEGWYLRRRPYQFALICVLALASRLVVIRFNHLVRAASRPLQLGLIATVVLVTFCAVRATSWHYFDRLLSIQWRGLHLNSALEGACALFIALTAAWELRDAPVRH